MPVSDAKSRLGRAFVQFPFELYQHEAQWVPPLRSALGALINQTHPFFAHSAGQAFLLVRDSAIVGRFMVLDPVLYNQHRGTQDARIFLPEAVYDDEVWDTLFVTARQWAEQRGASQLIGPLGPSPWLGPGVLVEGFEHTAAMTQTPWHHRWYHQQFERHEFVPHREYLSYYQTQPGTAGVSASDEMTVSRLENREELGRLAREIGQHWEEYHPLSPAEMDRLLYDYAPTGHSIQSLTVRNASGELAGFMLYSVDLSPALQRSNGYVGVRTILDLHREARRAKHLIVCGLGVLPPYQPHDVTVLLYGELVQEMKQRGIDSLETTFDPQSTKVFGDHVYKRHRVYVQTL